MISVICCYSSKEKIDSMLIKSLKNQDIEFESIYIDNTNSRFSSAAAALNYGFMQSKGEYIVFVHQDVIFDNEHFLQEIIDGIDELNRPAIVGLAGIKEKNGVYSNITHGPKNKVVGKYRLSNPVKVQTLDEVLLAMKREVFDKFQFDEKTCDNWHLYGVDLCLTAAQDDIYSYVIPLSLHHQSKGNVDSNYMKSLGKVVAKHKNNYDSFVTTITSVNTKYFNTFVFSTTYKFKHFLAPKLRKIGISKDIFRKLRG